MHVRLLVTAVVASTAVVVTAAGAQASVGVGSVSCAQADGRVSVIEIDSGVAYIGGSFTHVTTRGGATQPRAHLAAIDTATCDLLPWQAGANGDVEALAAVGGTLFVGGDFTSVSGASRKNLAAVSVSTGAPTSFDPAPNGAVLALDHAGDTLYAGGEFASVGGTTRARLAAFSVSTGALSSSWTPNASAKVFAVAAAPGGSRIYVGGNFTSLNGSSTRRYAAALSPTTGAVDTGFTPAGTVPVLDLAVDGTRVYAAGAGGGGRLLVWQGNGALAYPAFRTDGNVQAVAAGGGSVYAGGHFNTSCTGSGGGGGGGGCSGVQRDKLLEVSLATGAVTSWAPDVNSALGVWAAEYDPATGDLWVGGDFTKVGSVNRRHVAVFQPS